MIKNKRFALLFRFCAMIFAVSGLLKQIGVFDGRVSLGSFMYYTILSNLLAVILFAFLTIRTLQSLRKGACGSLGRYSRIEMICTVDLLVTFMVFWILLVPEVETGYLWTFENIAVHTVTPLLCLIDYILFSEAGRLKYRDIYYVCIFPLFYVAFTTIAGLAGYVYSFSDTFSASSSEVVEITPVRFPYFFLDFDKIGFSVIIYIAVLLLLFILLAHAFYFLDRRSYRKRMV